jgi:hypothetical protein
MPLALAVMHGPQNANNNPMQQSEMKRWEEPLLLAIRSSRGNLQGSPRLLFAQCPQLQFYQMDDEETCF